MYYAALSGIIMALSFPNFIISGFSKIPGYFVWISLVPLFFAVKSKKSSASFFLGWFSGFVFFCLNLYWILNITELGVLSPFGLIILSSYLAVYFAAFMLIIGYLRNKLSYIVKLFFIPAVWVILEYIRVYFLSGFPWSLLGYTQYNNLSIAQISSVTGVYGLSYLIVMINYFISEIADVNGFKSKKPLERKLFAAIPVVMILICIAYGNYKIIKIEKEPDKGKILKTALIQGNIKQDEKWLGENIDETFGIYDSLCKIDGKTDLIIWPETAAPIFLAYDAKYLKIVQSIALRQKCDLMAGTLDAVIDEKKNEKYYNAVFHFSSGGNIAGKYHKTHLVPFGEYTPFGDVLKFLEKFNVDLRHYSAGNEYKVFEISGLKTSVLICYECIFPGLVRKFSSKNIDFLINVTNDAFYGRSAMSYQHVSMLVLRSIENRLFSLRSANTGVSCIITPIGRIEEKLDIFERGAVIKEIEIKSFPSFYKSYGDIFVLLCLIFSAVFVVLLKLKIPLFRF